jgi:hypothetical protein
MDDSGLPEGGIRHFFEFPLAGFPAFLTAAASGGGCGGSMIVELRSSPAPCSPKQPIDAHSGRKDRMRVSDR